ncbi:MAG: amidase domain-containing protein [Clostridia bacterium]|nr:amidase domain-containing protein [Clostridia bacterium]
MLVVMEYRRERAVEYAERWAFSRNPLFENYTGIGGDCTNFVSQAIYAGSCVMNYTPTFGWYYVSPTNRAPAWTGVEYFYNFMTTNTGVGPFASETNAGGLLPGDVIQLARTGTGDAGEENCTFYHSLLVTGADESGYLVAAHSDDVLNRPLATYRYNSARFLRIEGVRIGIPDRYEPACFRDFLEGKQI